MKRRTKTLIAVLALCGATGAYAQSTQIYSYSIPTGGYAANGNVTAVSDSANGQWTNLQYDSLNRLISGALTRGTQATEYYCWAYDSFGNRTVQQISDQTFTTASGTSCQASGTLLSNTFTTPDSSNRIQSTNAGPSNIPLPTGIASTPTYDAAGNMTFDGRNHIAYDAENRVCAVLNEIGTLTQYLYNAEGQRVAKGHSGSGNTFSCPQYGDFVADEKYILGQSGEQVTQLNQINGADQWHHSNVWANGQLLATYNAQGLHFNISDPLGTKRVQTTAAGTPELSYASLPFGDGATTEGAADDATAHHFTGKERDSESGLDYFGARYMSSTMGRFMSPDDPFIDQDPSDPQSWNLYSYVRNNPLSNVDDDGHDCVTQTRTSDTTESISVSSGNCSGNVGDGQRQTYVPGTVTGISVNGGNSIDIGYNSYDGQSSGVTNAASAPIPDNPGLAFGYGNNAAGYNQLAGASNVVNTAGSVAIGIMAPWAGALAGCSSGGSAGSCAANLALSVLPEVAELKAGATLLKEAAVLGKKGAELLQKTGGAAQAVKEFEALKGAETIAGTTRIKTLSDGSKAVLYQSTGGSGAATIAIQHAGGGVTKIRY